MGWLRKQPPKLRKDGTLRKPRRSGDPNRTYFNKVNNVVIFLSAHGINRLLKKSEYPKYAEKPVVYYEAEQVKALYAAASNDDERFTLDYFLKSGVRDGEAAHAEYNDVKGSFLNIVDKPHLKWHPKHWHIEHRIGGITLRKNSLFPLEEHGFHALSDGREQCLGIEIEALLGHPV